MPTQEEIDTTVRQNRLNSVSQVLDLIADGQGNLTTTQLTQAVRAIATILRLELIENIGSPKS